MTVTTFIYHFVVANVLSLYYTVLILLLFLWNYIKNPFGDPWAQKLRLEPPACLTDPKYGVHKYIKVNNTKLHYVESGDPSKPLMIFVHGFPEFWYSWRYQILEFQKNYWCIAVDMRGYGDSEKPDSVSAYKLEILVEDLRDLVRQLGREKCIMVSHDWGGLIAARFREVHHDALLAVVVLASVSNESWYRVVWQDAKQLKKSWYVFFYRLPTVAENLMTMNDIHVLNSAMLVKGKTTVTVQDLECYKYWFGKPLAFTPPINYYRANFNYTLPEKKVCEQPVPFLYVMAENDSYLSTSMCESMKEEYKHIDTVVIKDCGHFMQQEEPEKVNKLIRDFLKKNNL